MNTVALAQNAYKSSTELSHSGKKNEYQIFARITHRLIETQKNLDGPANELLEAVHENLRLWGILNLPESIHERLLRAQKMPLH